MSQEELLDKDLFASLSVNHFVLRTRVKLRDKQVKTFNPTADNYHCFGHDADPLNC
jgi:hypothetical protein